MNQLARQAFAVNQANLALGCEVFQADGATFVRHRDFPEIRDVNHITNVVVETPAEIQRLFDRADIEFAACRFRIFHLAFDCPPAFEARLVLEGYERAADELIMVLEGPLWSGPLQSAERRLDIRPVENQADWQAFAELRRLDFREYIEQAEINDAAAIGDQLAQISMGASPPATYWLAYVDGVARGYFSSWAGLEGMGQVENLYVRPEFRHRGIATALIERCVADCREQGADQIVIVAAADDTPKNMYAAMGFRPVTLERVYRRLL